MCAPNIYTCVFVSLGQQQWWVHQGNEKKVQSQKQKTKPHWNEAQIGQVKRMEGKGNMW
jgi:hypothetical protein